MLYTGQTRDLYTAHSGDCMNRNSAPIDAFTLTSVRTHRERVPEHSWEVEADTAGPHLGMEAKARGGGVGHRGTGTEVRGAGPGCWRTPWGMEAWPPPTSD